MNIKLHLLGFYWYCINLKLVGCSLEMFDDFFEKFET